MAEPQVFKTHSRERERKRKRLFRCAWFSSREKGETKSLKKFIATRKAWLWSLGMEKMTQMIFIKLAMRITPFFILFQSWGQRGLCFILFYFIFCGGGGIFFSWLLIGFWDICRFVQTYFFTLVQEFLACTYIPPQFSFTYALQCRGLCLMGWRLTCPFFFVCSFLNFFLLRPLLNPILGTDEIITTPSLA